MWHRRALGASHDSEIPADDDRPVERGRVRPRDTVRRADDGRGASRRGGAYESVPLRREAIDRKPASSRPPPVYVE
jgi:hypothetical protein